MSTPSPDTTGEFPIPAGTDPSYAALFDWSSDALFFHREGRVLRVNRAAVARFGAASAHAMVGVALSTVIHPDSQAFIATRIDALHSGALQTTPPMAVRMRTLDGHDFEVESQAHAVPYDGQPAILVQLRDVSARRKVEQALRDSEGQFRQMIEWMPDPLLIARDGRILYANPAAATIFGAPTAATLVGTDLLARIAADAPVGRATKFAAIVGEDGRHTPEVESAIVRLDGSRRAVVARGTAVTYDGASALLISLRDVTDAARIAASQREHAAAQAELTERLVRAQQVGNVGSWETDLVTMDVTWSRQTHAIFETDPATFHPTHPAFLACIPSTERAAVEAAFQASIAAGTGGAVEHRIMTATGRVKHVLERWQIGTDAAGRPIRALGTCADITERKLAEIALRDSEFRWKFAIEGSGDGLWDWDVASGAVTLSRRWKEMLGYADHELQNTVGEWERLLHPDDVAPATTALQALLAGHTPAYANEHRLRGKDGHWAWILSRGVVVARDADGRALRVIGTHRDITESKQAAEALQEMEARYRGLVESVFDGSVVHQDGRIVDANAAYGSIFGYATDALLGQPVLAMMAPESRDATARRIAAADETPYEAIGQRQDGSRVAVEIVGKAVTHRGRPARLAVVRDISARKRAEQALAESEARYRTVTERSCAPLLVHRNGRLLYANPAACALVGVPTSHELQGTDIQQFVHPADRSRAAEPLPPVGVGEAAPLVALQVFALDGTRRDVESQSTPISYDGRPATAVSLRDVTAQRRAEAALEESREKFRALSEGSFAAILIYDQGRILELNRQAELMFGYSAAEAVGMEATAAVLPADRDLVRAAMDSGDETPYEVGAVRKDGSTFPALVRGRMSHFQGKSVRVTSIIDLSTLRQAESEARLQGAALEAAANMIVITDRQGRIVWANAAFTAETGYTRDEALGRTPGELLNAGVQDAAFYRDLWDTIIAGRVWTGELTNRRKDGTQYVEEMTITPVPDASGDVQHFIAVKQNVLQRKTLEAQFRQAQKMESVGRLAGGVAHDFNNALGAIVVAMEFALREVPPTHRAHTDLRLVQATAVRASGIAQQLLQFARQQPIVPATLDLNTALPSILGMLQRLLGEDIELVWQPADAVWPVWMDPSQIDQILTNLCINARDAIADVGTITLRTDNQVVDDEYAATHPDASPGEYVRLRVSDTGCGMPPDTLAQIFEPFFTTKGAGEGTGLGLASVYGAVRQNGGFLVVESAVGTGSTFAIYLPRRSRDAVTPVDATARPRRAAPRTSRPTPGQGTVLLVDDDEVLLLLAERVLQENGYTVMTAMHPEAAARLAAGYPGAIDILVTDVIMPTMNGRDLARALSVDRPAMRVLYVSGHSASAISKRGILDPGVHFIQKPFTIEQLATMMREVLAAPV